MYKLLCVKIIYLRRYLARCCSRQRRTASRAASAVPTDFQSGSRVWAEWRRRYFSNSQGEILFLCCVPNWVNSWEGNCLGVGEAKDKHNPDPFLEAGHSDYLAPAVKCVGCMRPSFAARGSREAGFTQLLGLSSQWQSGAPLFKQM